MKRNKFIYILSTVVITLGGIVYTFAISYFILNETGSSLYFSINTAILSIGSLFSLPISGVLVDSYNRKRIINILEGASALTLLILIIYISIFGFNVYFLFIITAIRSLITPVISNAFDASLTQLFDRENIQNIIGKIASYETTIFLLGPIIAGALYGFFTLESMILVFLIMQIISLISNIFLEFKDSNSKIKEDEVTKLDNWLKRFGSKLIIGMKYIKNSNVLLRILILSTIINAVGAASFSVLPETIMIKELNFQATQVGIVNAVLGTGSLLASLLLSKFKIKNPLRVVKSAFIVISFLMLLFTLPVYYEMSTINSMIYIALGGVAMAFTFQFISIPLSSFMQKTVSDEYKGRVFSTNSTVGMILMPLGTVIFGFLYELGIYFSVNLFSSIIILVTVFFILTNKTLKKSTEEYNK